MLMATVTGCWRRESEQDIQLSLERLCDTLSIQYRADIKIINNETLSEDKKVALLRKEILIKHEQYTSESRSFWHRVVEYENYPWLWYKEQLDNDKRRILRLLNHIVFRTQGIGALANRLLDRLDEIRRIVITSEEYLAEKKEYRADKRMQHIENNSDIIAISQIAQALKPSQPTNKTIVHVHNN